jgi:hypothetical protein
MTDIVRAVSDYATEDENYLSFTKGEGFQVINRQHSGWLWVKSMQSEQFGYVPRTYVEPMDLKVWSCSLITPITRVFAQVFRLQP